MPPAAAQAVAALSSALSNVARDYGSLSHAAAHNNKASYVAARNAIANDSRAISAAFAELAKLGYVVS